MTDTNDGGANGSKNVSPEDTCLSSQAQQHGSVAIAGLLDIMRTCQSDALRVTAINMLLDRGYGKPPQSLGVAVQDEVPWPELRTT